MSSSLFMFVNISIIFTESLIDFTLLYLLNQMCQNDEVYNRINTLQVRGHTLTLSSGGI